MSRPRDRSTRRALLIGAAAGGSLLAVVVGIATLTAPGVEATCDRVVMLAERAGESVDDDARDLCVQDLEQRRAELGSLRWTRLARCIAAAESLPEAGGCRGR